MRFRFERGMEYNKRIVNMKYKNPTQYIRFLKREIKKGLKKTRCTYNVSKNAPEYLPIIECGKRAKYMTTVSYEDESFDLYICKQHIENVNGCSNIGEIIKL